MVRATGFPPLPANTQGASSASPKRGSRGWGSSSDGNAHYSGRRFTTPWVSSNSHPLLPLDERIPTTPNVQLPPGFSSPPISVALQSGWVSAQWIVRCNSAPMTLPCRIKRMTVIGWMLGASYNPALQFSGPFAPPVSRPCLDSLNSPTSGRLRSCRSYRGTQGLHVVPISACSPRTSTARGMLLLASMRVSGSSLRSR